jgi:PAS domain S-box-containing protein
MKVSKKLIILFAAAFLITLVSSFIFRYNDVRQRRILLESQKNSYESIVNNVIKFKQEKYISASDDYSGWDDMVAYVKSHSKEWAETNLNTVISTFKVDYVWVYDAEEKILHNTKNEEMPDIKSLKDYVKISPIFEKKPFRNFFIRVDSQLVQVFGGTIVPTSDFTQHLTKPLGYYLIGKVWSNKYIEEYEKSTDTKIEIKPISDTLTAHADSIDICIRKPLNDWQDKGMLLMNFNKSITYLEEFDNNSFYALIYTTLIGIATILLILFFSKKWVTDPLGTVTNTLISRNKRHLEKLLNKKNEFRDIAELISSFFDVNDKLIENEKNLDTVLNATNDIIVLTDTNLKIIAANKAFATETNNNLSEVIGKKLSDHVPEKIISTRIEYFNKVVSEGKEIIFEDFGINKYWRNSIYPIKDKNGKVVRIALYGMDITESRMYQESLKKAEERANEANQIKSNFLANMSHELRTPLVAILGFSEILINDAKEPTEREYSKTIYNSGKRLLETLNLILDLSRVEANKEEVTLVEINVTEKIFEIAQFYNVMAEEKGLYVKVSSHDEELFSFLDERLFNSIIGNIVNNAIKYTNTGGVEINIDKKGEKNDRFVSVKIKDTGIGIPEDSLKIIFDDFRQVSEGIGRRFEGTGLGLAITKRYVELLNGNISVVSEFGKGTIFTIEFPATIKSEIEIPEKEAVISQKVTPGIKKPVDSKTLPKVLLIDDDDSVSVLLCAILKNTCNVEYAKTSDAALDLLGKKVYEIILLDINLGKGLSGLDILKQVREKPEFKNTIVIALTAYAMSGDKEKFLNAGCDRYISKPFSRQDVLNVINEVMQKMKNNRSGNNEKN